MSRTRLTPKKWSTRDSQYSLQHTRCHHAVSNTHCHCAVSNTLAAIMQSPTHTATVQSPTHSLPSCSLQHTRCHHAVSNTHCHCAVSNTLAAIVHSFKSSSPAFSPAVSFPFVLWSGNSVVMIMWRMWCDAVQASSSSSASAARPFLFIPDSISKWTDQANRKYAAWKMFAPMSNHWSRRSIETRRISHLIRQFSNVAGRSNCEVFSFVLSCWPKSQVTHGARCQKAQVIGLADEHNVIASTSRRKTARKDD